MSRLSRAPRHDPYWDVDGAGARRDRTRRRLSRYAIWVVALAVLTMALSQVPRIDPDYLIHGDGRPIFAGALLTLLAAAVLLALVRIRHVSRS